MWLIIHCVVCMVLNLYICCFFSRIDCAGILKLRNSDIELRKGETDIGRKNTRVRLVFRVHINQSNGRTVSLQTTSNPIECCKSHTYWEKKEKKKNTETGRTLLLASWLSISAKGGIHCCNPINWATILITAGANSKRLHPISFIWLRGNGCIVYNARHMCYLF